MERITRLRVQILVAIFGLIIVFFAFKLYDLQIIETGGSTLACRTAFCSGAFRIGCCC